MCVGLFVFACVGMCVCMCACVGICACVFLCGGECVGEHPIHACVRAYVRACGARGGPACCVCG